MPEINGYKIEKNANLRDAQLSNVDLSNQNLSGAQLWFANLSNSNLTTGVDIMSTVNRKGTLQIYPNSYTEEFNEWSLDDFGPVTIPKKGVEIELNSRNMDMYRRVISVYDGHVLEEKNGEVYIDGELATNYTFEQDYYWMMGDNRHRSADSRMWGFVPHDHIVGRASFTWFSRQNKAQHGEAKIRWDRVFTNVK